MFNWNLKHGLAIVAIALVGTACTKSKTIQPKKDSTVGPEKSAGATPYVSPQDANGQPVFTDTRRGNQVANQNPDQPGAADQPTVNIDNQGENIRINGDRGTVEPSGGSTVKYKDFTGTIDDAQIQKWVEADKAKRGADAANFRYAFIPTRFLDNKENANRARIGLSKALNHVAVNADKVYNPEDASDGHGIVFAVPITKYWGAEGQRKWDYAAAAQGRRPFSPAPRLSLQSFDANAPVSADRVAYNVLHGAVYNELIETPRGNGAGRSLKRQLGVTGEPTANIGVQNAITYGPRFARRYDIPGRPGAYWESLDDFNGRKRGMIWLDGSTPRDRGDGMISDFGTTASETWYHMKNGLPAYFIFGNANQERSKAEKSFVTDPLNNQTGDLVTGFCVFCHLAGVQSAPNDMWTALEEGRVQGNVERARQFWTSNEELSKQYKEDRDIIINAMTEIVNGMSDSDKDWNNSIIQGADGKEPCYYLTAELRRDQKGGQTDGLRRRGEDGQLGN